MKHRQKKTTPTPTRLKPDKTDDTMPFVGHLLELRRRLIYIVVSVLIFSTLAYSVQQRLVDFLLRPSHGQQFIYTSPAGGIGFLFTVCTYAGIVISTPIIFYQTLGFLEPLIKNKTRQTLIKYSFFSAALGLVGFCFGYFMGLPIALHFLGSQFSNHQIRPLFTIQEYLSFLMIYLLGSVLLCQIPVILMFINKIRPLRPRKLLSFERYVIVTGFLIAMIMAPTTNVIDQLIIAGPIIMMYNLSVLLIWFVNRGAKRPENVLQLLEIDKQVQAERFNKPLEPLVQPKTVEPVTSLREAPLKQFILPRRQFMDIRRATPGSA